MFWCRVEKHLLIAVLGVKLFKKNIPNRFCPGKLKQKNTHPYIQCLYFMLVSSGVISSLSSPQN